MSADLDRAAADLLVFFLDTSVRALVVTVLAAAALMMMRPKRSAARLAAWTVVLFGLIALPLVSVALGAFGWTIPIATAFWGTLSPIAAAPELLEIVSSHTAVAATVNPSAGAPVASPPWLVLAAAVYLFVALLLLARVGVGWLFTRRLERRARPLVEASAVARAQDLAAAHGMRRPPRLAEVDGLVVPVTTAVVRPVILLPADWREWTTEALEAVLAHEIAHAARRDALTQRLSLLYRAFTWPSPLGWWLHRKLSNLAEQASDEAALEAGSSRSAYARVLVEFLARVQHAPRRAAWHVAMARRAGRDAERRVDRILNWKAGSPMPHTRRALIGIVLAASSVVAVTAAIVPEPAPPLDPAPIAQTAPPQKPAPPAQAKPGEPRQHKVRPPRIPVLIHSAQSKVGAVSFGIARPRQGAPAAIVRISSSRADGGYASIVVNNTGSKTIRSVVVAAYVRPIGQPDAEPRVFTSPALVTWIPQGGGRTLEPRLIDPATLSEVGSANPQGATATIDFVRIEFIDGTSWTPGSTPVVESEPEPAQAGGNPFLGGAYPTNTPDLVPPEAIRRVQPRYTSDAMRAKIQGVVILEAVVDASGRVGRTRVVESLDTHFGLDHEAAIAANQWLFRPATLNGQPVPAVITLTLEFRLH